jgi:Exo-beta-D-glucosaminidase Ig-fold domain
VELFTLDGKSVFKSSKNLQVGATTVSHVLELKEELRNRQGIYFLVLNLTDNRGMPVSHNVYWLSEGNDFKSLRNIPNVTLQTKLTRTETAVADENKWTCEISNPSENIAFFINPQLWNESEEIMPTFWSSNYFTLAPGEKITVTARCPKPLSAKKPFLKLEGWNISGN